MELKGWKPLAFEQLTSDPDATVDTFLKDFASHLSLKILTKGYRHSHLLHPRTLTR